MFILRVPKTVYSSTLPKALVTSPDIRCVPGFQVRSVGFMFHVDSLAGYSPQSLGTVPMPVGGIVVDRRGFSLEFLLLGISRHACPQGFRTFGAVLVCIPDQWLRDRLLARPLVSASHVPSSTPIPAPVMLIYLASYFEPSCRK